MPTYRLPDRLTTPSYSPLAWQVILGLMAFPGDTDRQEELLAYRFLTDGSPEARDWTTVRIGQSMLPMALKRAIDRGNLLQEYERNFYSGLCVGELLHLQFFLEAVGEEGGRHKAVSILVQQWQEEIRDSRLPYRINAKDLEYAWKQHRSVAHFWAAYWHHLANLLRPYSMEEDSTSFVVAVRDLSSVMRQTLPYSEITDFLGLAESYLRCGLTHRPRHARETLFLEADMWRIAWPLPLPIGSFDFAALPLTPDLKERLSRYRRQVEQYQGNYVPRKRKRT